MSVKVSVFLQEGVRLGRCKGTFQAQGEGQSFSKSNLKSSELLKCSFTRKIRAAMGRVGCLRVDQCISHVFAGIWPLTTFQSYLSHSSSDSDQNDSSQFSPDRPNVNVFLIFCVCFFVVTSVHGGSLDLIALLFHFLPVFNERSSFLFSSSKSPCCFPFEMIFAILMNSQKRH